MTTIKQNCSDNEFKIGKSIVINNPDYFQSDIVKIKMVSSSCQNVSLVYEDEWGTEDTFTETLIDTMAGLI